MGISGTEHSSVILSQIKKSDSPKVTKLAEAKWNGVINDTHKTTISRNFEYEKCYDSTEVDHRTCLHVPSGTLWYTSSDAHQVFEIQNGTSTKMYTPFYI